MKDTDQIIAWMRSALEEGSSWLPWINGEPRFDWIRHDPDFVALLQAMKFP